MQEFPHTHRAIYVVDRFETRTYNTNDALNPPGGIAGAILTVRQPLVLMRLDGLNVVPGNGHVWTVPVNGWSQATILGRENLVNFRADVNGTQAMQISWLKRIKRG